MTLFVSLLNMCICVSDVTLSVLCHRYAEDPVEGHILENSPGWGGGDFAYERGGDARRKF